MDKLDRSEIAAILPDELKDLDIEVFEEIDSTNTYVKRKILEAASCVDAPGGAKACHALGATGLVVANRQTLGRGRSGHSFYSPENTGIYMSYYYTPESGLANAELITTRTAIAVVRALESLYHERFGIKWVNDIYYNDHKIAGILTEAVTTGINQGTVVVGIGINVTTTDFPDEIAGRAGSLPLKGDISRNTIIGNITRELTKMSRLSLDDRSYYDEYDSRLMLKGDRVSYLEKGETKYGTVVGVNKDFALILKDDAGQEVLIDSGEVSEMRKL